MTANGGGAGNRPGSAPESTTTRLPTAPIAALLLLFALATPAAGQVATGGVMRFATDEVAFIGGFGGVAADVWLLEPFAYLSHNAGVWAVQAGAAVPVFRLERRVVPAMISGDRFRATPVTKEERPRRSPRSRAVLSICTCGHGRA